MVEYATVKDEQAMGSPASNASVPSSPGSASSGTTKPLNITIPAGLKSSGIRGENDIVVETIAHLDLNDLGKDGHPKKVVNQRAKPVSRSEIAAAAESALRMLSPTEEEAKNAEATFTACVKGSSGSKSNSRNKPANYWTLDRDDDYVSNIPSAKRVDVTIGTIGIQSNIRDPNGIASVSRLPSDSSGSAGNDTVDGWKINTHTTSSSEKYSKWKTKVKKLGTNDSELMGQHATEVASEGAAVDKPVLQSVAETPRLSPQPPIAESNQSSVSSANSPLGGVMSTGVRRIVSPKLSTPKSTASFTAPKLVASQHLSQTNNFHGEGIKTESPSEAAQMQSAGKHDTAALQAAGSEFPSTQSSLSRGRQDILEYSGYAFEYGVDGDDDGDDDIDSEDTYSHGEYNDDNIY